MGIKQDVIMQMVEKMADTFQEVEAAGMEDPREGLQSIDEALTEAFRARPETLHMQLRDGLDEVDGRIAAEAGRLLVLRNRLAEQLKNAGLAEKSLHFAFRGLLEGARMPLQGQDLIAADVLADLLRQERTARVIPPDDMARAWRTLFEIEADRQRFPTAEDYLFHAIDLSEDPTPIIRKGLRFFEKVEQLPDDILERRGLPRDEVEAAIDELRELLRREA